MSNPQRESENVEAIAPLELNKETLQDLDVNAGEAQDVMGGAVSYVAKVIDRTLTVSETCITPYKGGAQSI